MRNARGDMPIAKGGAEATKRIIGSAWFNQGGQGDNQKQKGGGFPEINLSTTSLRGPFHSSDFFRNRKPDSAYKMVKKPEQDELSGWADFGRQVGR